MSEIVISLPEVDVSTDSTVEIDSKLPEAAADVTKSITVEIQPENYVLTSGGMYTGNMTGATPTWLLNAIQQQLTTGDGNVTSVLNDMQLLLDDLQLGVNQAISQIENTNVSMSALETSLSSQIGANSADILDVYATRVTADEAQAIATTAIGTTFNGNVDAYIANLASVYTAPGSATATNIATLQASYNDQTARIDTVEEVAVAAAKIIRSTTAPTISTHPTLNNGDYWIDIDNSNIEYVWNGVSWDETTTGSAEQAVVWSANASKLITAPDGSVTGWSFGDGTGVQSEFKIQAEKFSISDGTTGYTPFSITGSDINFLGKVSFNSVTGAPTHTSGLLSARPLTAVLGSTYTATDVPLEPVLYTYTSTGWIQGGDPDALTAEDLGPTGTTVIDGGRITTGTVQADRLKAGTNSSTVWTGGGLISTNFNGNAAGDIGTPTAGFRLSSNAVGTSTDPNIYGAYIKGGIMEATSIISSSISLRDLQVLTDAGKIARALIMSRGSISGGTLTFNIHPYNSTATDRNLVLAASYNQFMFTGSITHVYSLYDYYDNIVRYYNYSYSGYVIIGYPTSDTISISVSGIDGSLLAGNYNYYGVVETATTINGIAFRYVVSINSSTGVITRVLYMDNIPTITSFNSSSFYISISSGSVASLVAVVANI